MPDTSATTSVVQDTASGYMNDLDALLEGIQTKINGEQSQQQSAMTQFVQAESALWVSATSFGGPPPKVMAPTWKGSSEPKTASYEEAFEPRVRSVVFGVSADSAIASIDAETLGTTIEGQFQKTFETYFGENANPKPTKTSCRQPYLDWIAASIISLASDLDAARRLELQLNLIQAVMKAADADLFAAQDKDKGFSGAYNKYIKPSVTALVTEGQKSATDKQKVVDEIMSSLEIALNKATRPDDEEQIRSIIRITIEGLPKSVLDDNNIKEELTSELEDAVTDLFPQPDQASFYLNVQSSLRKNLLQGAQGGTKPSGTGNGQADPQKEAKNQQAKKKNDSTASGLDDLIQKTVTSHMGSGSEAQGLIADLRKQARGIVDDALDVTFLELSEQGVQGRVISTVRDYQLVNRISGYTEQVLNQLPQDLKERIPQNQKNTLTAAQAITKASVSYRQFANSLEDLKTAYKGERDLGDKGETGTNAATVGKLVDGPPDGVGDYDASDLHEAAQAIYLARNEPPPQVKSAEYTGVTLAADSAGLNTSLDQILMNEQAATVASLKELTANFKKVMDSQISGLPTSADKYFADVDTYVNDRVAWEVDQVDVTALETSLTDLANIAKTGLQ